MRLRPIYAVTLPFIAALPLALSNCSSDDSTPGGGAGAGGATSGGSGTGGAKATTGGVSSGGSISTGGVVTGGTSFGGTAPTGGKSAAGGASGGTVSAGGTPATGGTSPATGGTSGGGSSGGTSGGESGAGTGGSSPGGSSGTGKWGEVENPGAGCMVGPLPSASSLMANPKLPDPFKKMDGTRITTKSEWRCRREEILRQAYAFIYGDKPVPNASDVTGTVSSSRITVEAKGEKGTASFEVTVNMNGATAPAPALIRYGNSGASAPNGVASINFSAIESTGGSGNKNGPFYSAYGADHAAGYLTAQAWQISRILDVLEKNPGTIDPKRVGVTGCSRWGKGAFVAGVLDNRIALTIPVESGLGGTVALRLVEQLDAYNGNEMPYHGISYVRWMSEKALGQFVTGNMANTDNTDKLPIDMHEMMALIAPRGLYVVDNPSTTYPGLDRNTAYVTGKVGKMIFEALGVGANFAYQGASGDHCQWRSQYTASLNAMVDKFLKGNASAETGNVATDLSNPPNHLERIDWEAPTLSGEL